MKKSLIAVCIWGSMLATTMPMNATTVWSSPMSEEPNAAPEKSRGVIARMELAEFSAVYCDVVANITIEQGDEYLIEARGPEHIIRLIEPEVSKGMLRIKASKEYKVKKNGGVNIRVVAPSVEAIENDGVGNITFKELTKTEELKVKNDGVGNITIENLQCNVLYVQNDGVGNVCIDGKAGRAVFTSNGVGNIEAFDLETADLSASLNGVGGIECYVTERFTCQANGVGSIYYKGEPKHTNIRSSGIGKVRRR